MQELENWLREVEQNLSDLPPAEKSKIILNLDQQIRNHGRGGHKIDDILEAFGTPAQAASRARFNSYSELTTEPLKPASSGKFWKWATIILVGGFFGIIALVVLIPLLLFKLFTFSSFHKDMNFSFTNSISSAHLSGTLAEPGLKHFIFKAGNGQVVVKSDDRADAQTFSYSCKVSSESRLVDDSALVRTAPDTLSFELSDATSGGSDKADCKITVPRSAAIDIEIGNGHAEVQNAQQEVIVHMQNGRIEFTKKADVTFEVAASASTGQIKGLGEFNQKQNSIGPRAGTGPFTGAGPGPGTGAETGNSNHYKADLKVKTGQIEIH